MNLAHARLLLVVILIVGAIARVQAWLWGVPLYPDAYCQYLDPAWLRVSGFGVETWEWRDGIRSWVLPGYHGAWMALLSTLGIRGSVIGNAIQLHWVLLSLTMVIAAYRGVSSMVRQSACASYARFANKNPDSYHTPTDGRRAGLFVAALIAFFPQLCRYAGTTLSEQPSMIGLVVGLCLTAELVEAKERASSAKAMAIGFVLSFAVCLRIVNAPLALLAPLWLLVGGARQVIVPMGLGALAPIAFFGVVDRLTWGEYFHSFFAYLKFNIVEGRASDFGEEPPAWYWKKLFARQPLGTYGLIALALLGTRLNWPFLLGAFGMMTLISSQPHKEERFMILIWPLLLIAAGTTAGRWLERSYPLKATIRSWLRKLIEGSRAIRLALVLGAGALLIFEGTGREEERRRFGETRARFVAQAWVAERPSATGTLSDWLLYTGGYMWSDHTYPVLKFERSRLANPIFSHVIAPWRSSEAREARAVGFTQVWQHGDIVVLERPKFP